jgi:hypothetical protein
MTVVPGTTTRTGGGGTGTGVTTRTQPVATGGYATTGPYTVVVVTTWASADAAPQATPAAAMADISSSLMRRVMIVFLPAGPPGCVARFSVRRF